MVQTRGQQTGDQSPSSHGVLRGITAEGDAVSTAVTSGNTLKQAVSVPSTEHSAAVLAGGGSGWDEPAAALGAGSPTTISVSAPKGVSALPSGVISTAGNGVQMTDDRCPTGDPRLPYHRWSNEWLGQRQPPSSIQCATAQKPDQSTSYLRGSEQQSCHYELWFPGRSACSNSRWDSAGWGI